MDFGAKLGNFGLDLGAKLGNLGLDLGAKLGNLGLDLGAKLGNLGSDLGAKLGEIGSGLGPKLSEIGAARVVAGFGGLSNRGRKRIGLAGFEPGVRERAGNGERVEHDRLAEPHYRTKACGTEAERGAMRQEARAVRDRPPVRVTPVFGHNCCKSHR